MVSEASLFRPRRRPLLRLSLTLAVLTVLAVTGGIVVWLRLHVVPPGCRDPATLALLRQNLTRLHVPQDATIVRIQTHAGGYVAFRFVCEADLENIDRDALPPGTDVPGTVHYISRLTDGGQRHEVTVSIEPRITWERVQ